jgi:hypothetical protein
MHAEGDCLSCKPALIPRISWLSAGGRGLRTARLLPSWYKPGTGLPILISPMAARPPSGSSGSGRASSARTAGCRVPLRRGGCRWPGTPGRGSYRRRCWRPDDRAAFCRCPAVPTCRSTRRRPWAVATRVPEVRRVRTGPTRVRAERTRRAQQRTRDSRQPTADRIGRRR